jgi:hypothetical protein
VLSTGTLDGGVDSAATANLCWSVCMWFCRELFDMNDAVKKIKRKELQQTVYFPDKLLR